jgi:hypothetical protein
VTFINVQRKLHFVLFNLVTIDVAFIGTRTLLHTRYHSAVFFPYFMTLLLYTLMIMDVVEIAWISGTLMYETQKRIKGWKELKEGQDPKEDMNESRFKLREHEKNFDKKRVGGFGIRQYFWDDELKDKEDNTKGGLTRETVKKLGYVKVIDYNMTRKYLDHN